MAVFQGYVIKFLPDNYIPPKVSDFGPANQDLDSAKSKRNLQGTLFRDKIATIPDMDLEVPELNQAEMGALLRHLSPIKFNLQYWDPESETYKTSFFYCPSAGRRPKILKYNPLTYKAMSFRLVGYQNVD